MITFKGRMHRHLAYHNELQNINNNFTVAVAEGGRSVVCHTIPRQDASHKNLISIWGPPMSKILQIMSSSKTEALNQVMDTCDLLNSLLQPEYRLWISSLIISAKFVFSEREMIIRWCFNLNLFSYLGYT